MSSPEEEESPTFQEIQEMFYSLRRSRAEQNPALPLLSPDGDDMVGSLMAQVADLANMCETMFLQLCLVHAQMSPTEEVTIGLKAFTRSADEWQRGKTEPS